MLFRQKINFFNDLKFFQNRLQNISTLSWFHPKNVIVVTKLAEKYDNTLSGLLISNNIVNTLSASLITVVFTAILGEGGVGVATAVITVLLVVFGEVLPKTFAANNAEKLIKITQKPLHIIMLILAPFIKILEIIYAGKIVVWTIS